MYAHRITTRPPPPGFLDFLTTVVHLQVLQRPSVEFSVEFFLLDCTHQTQFDFSKKSLLQSKLTQYVCKLNLDTISKRNLISELYLIYILEQSMLLQNAKLNCSFNEHKIYEIKSIFVS